MENPQAIESAPASATPDLPSPTHQNETSNVSVDELQTIVERERASQGIAPSPELETIGTLFKDRLRSLPPEVAALSEQRAIDYQRREVESAKRERFDRLVNGAGAAFRGKTINTFNTTTPAQKTVVAEVRKYIATVGQELKAGRGLVLYGPCGTGKDHLLFSVARVVCESRGVLWVNGQDWFGEIRDDMDSDGKFTEKQRIARLATVPLLVLSDPLPPFGSLSQHMSTMLYRLMNDRIEAGLPTFVSINVKDDAEAETRLGTATWDRICDNAWKMRCDWPSYRNPYRKVNC